MTTWAILASGPSMSQEVADSVRPLKNVIAVSNTFELAPWADVLVSNDRRWWINYPKSLDFEGEKVCGLCIEAPKGVEKFLGAMSGSNSGLLALMVAVKKGAKRILLFGFDMAGSHYFGDHINGLANPSPQRFQKFKEQFAAYKPAGVEIINCTPGSVLKCYPFGDASDYLPEKELPPPEPPRGEKGERGEKGIGERGPRGPEGPQGPMGPMPDHQWDGTRLRFEEPSGGWGKYVDLRGPMGHQGASGGSGKSEGGMTPLQALQLQTLLDIFGGWIAGPPVVAITALVADALEVSGTATATGFYAGIPGGAPVDAAYEWDWGDGGASSTLNAVHTYAEAGTYVVSFRARNHIGWSDWIADEITVAPSSLWTPADAGFEDYGWYVSDAPGNTVVGGLLDTLFDRSGNGRHAGTNQGNTDNRASLANTQNGRTVYSCSGTSAPRGLFRTGTNSIDQASTGVSFFIVHKRSPDSAWTQLMHMDRGNGYHTRKTLGRSDIGNTFGGGRRLIDDPYDDVYTGGSDGNDWQIAEAVLDHNTATATIYRDGTQLIGKNPWQTTGLTDDVPSLFFSIGHYTDLGNAVQDVFTGDIAEVLVVRGPVNTTNRQLIEGYLAWQWGLEGSLPGDHPYKSAAPIA